LYPLFKSRLLYLALAAGLFFLSFYVGAVVWISPEHAANIRQELGQRNKNLDQLGIFANNLAPSLEMFIPAAGLVVGAYSAVSTGLAFNAFALANPALKSIFPLSVLISPFAIMEILAYSLAMSRSAIIAYYLVRKPRSWKNSWKKYLIPTIIEVAIVVLVLYIGSVVEWQKLSQST
jgi:hypothetical protein